VRRASAILLLTAALAVMFAPGPASAGEASLTDIEDEVMCPVCGTLLELSEAPQAERERVFIRKLIAEGRSKEQIKDALVAEYGPGVLATPQGSGFDLTAYLVPVVAFVLAAVAVAIALRRWRLRPEPVPERAPSGEDAERLDSDIARYDL
jgi:cytochrome c-type biogenesis protein CcmH